MTISPTSTDFELSDFSPYFFRTVPNDAMAAKALSDYMRKSLKLQKAAVFFSSQSNYSKSLKSKFIEELSHNGGLEFDLSDSNFIANQSVNKTIEKKAQVLVLAANNATLDKALLVAQANQKKLKLLGGDDVYATKTLADGGEAVVGMVVAVAWHIDADPASNFSQQSQQLWKSRVSWRTAMSYDATQALIEAIKRNPTRLGVQQALSAPNFSATGASGKVKFLSSGDRIGTVQLVEVCKDEKSATGYNFVPVGRNCKV